ncbi:MAG TPA: hypothetical protein PLM98_05740 [Thiolinea sp.]|nr:hypothetical protein [Thiolinea sp.]
MPNTITYSIPVKIFFWLFWLVGVLAVLLFILFTISSANSDQYFPQGWGYAIWDGLIVLSGIFLLFKTARHFFKADIDGGKLMLWVALAAFGLPLIGFGGCMLPASLGLA